MCSFVMILHFPNKSDSVRVLKLWMFLCFYWAKFLHWIILASCHHVLSIFSSQMILSCILFGGLETSDTFSPTWRRQMSPTKSLNKKITSLNSSPPSCKSCTSYQELLSFPPRNQPTTLKISPWTWWRTPGRSVLFEPCWTSVRLETQLGFEY